MQLEGPELTGSSMTDPIIALLVLLLPPVVQILIMVAARLALESGDPARPSVELDHLLTLKRVGTLVRGSPKIPDSSARSQPLVASHKAAHVRGEAWDDGLEHLLLLKRKRDAHAFSNASVHSPRSADHSEWGD
jgi:hypothetical protein